MKLLGNDVRWRLVAGLAASDRKVNELVDLVQEPANLVSYHLGQLRRNRLVNERRSLADGRDVYYSLDLQSLEAAFERSAGAIHPGLWPAGPSAAATSRTGPPARVLFLCTHNSARSLMAEAIARHRGGSALVARSAGSEPTSAHPSALRVLRELGIDTAGLRSKPLDQVAGDRFDHVITVCDVVREACPSWPGDPELVHWSVADPSQAAGDEETEAAFRSCAVELIRRVRYFLAALPEARGRGAA